ncbi:hypothetical protein QQX10_05270 [Demequina sp. SYSU T00039]|uniref:Uncharacterized protein n=1 Tax=Demequina lignilytica TaxID=3051663 RepID=A0AAW7M7G8_9MICO|nr:MULTISPECIES: hypothetical protein [unclassified Demequina]MDN4479260.1 hypothetical protein [Demequina sp. SYSU T00039-1]MDN4487578.1 hypothetical protein [Demequina sp. SYSU T00039]
MGGNSDGSPLIALFLFALGPGAGVAVWMWIQGHYRNRSARYRPEEVVRTHVVDLRGDDALVRRLRTRSGSIDGGNELRPEQRARVWRVIEAPVEAPPEPHPTAEDLADPDGGDPGPGPA